MNGISLKLDSDNKTLILTIEPQACDKGFDFSSVENFVLASEYNEALIDSHALLGAVDQAREKIANDSNEIVELAIGEIKDAEIQLEISPDEMDAELTITAAQGGNTVTLDDINAALEKNKICRGISYKRIARLLNKLSSSDPGESVSDIIAIGLPPKKGKDSRIKPLVPNALDRILKPQKKAQDKVDMRDLGAIVCVEQGKIVAKKLPPRPGRNGFTIRNNVVKALEGEDKNMKLGDNTHYFDQDPEMIAASVSGQPKFSDGVMRIDDVYTVNGVNVKTGHVDYDGAVIVNGDVTENMRIVATGDVTVNGFVESAYIKSDGDIIVTQGVTGKPDGDESTLDAGGSVGIFHGQHVKIFAGKEIRVVKQLSHSSMRCKGNVIVGQEGNLDGSLFACKIKAGGSIEAGTLGAVSGSRLEIDYSDSFNTFYSKHESLVEMRQALESNTAAHEMTYIKLKRRRLRPSVKPKIEKLKSILSEERDLLKWVRQAEEDISIDLDDFKKGVQVIAHEQLFAGVEIKINKNVYRTNKNYHQTMVSLKRGEWLIKDLKD